MTRYSAIALACMAICLGACGQETVLVQGNGSIQYQPDMATITASVIATGASTQAAASEVNKRTLTVLDGLKQLGLDPKTFGAERFSVDRQCYYDNGKQICSGYQASDSVVIRTTDLTRLGEVLGRLAELGVDNVQPPDFDAKDSAKFAAQARQKAFEDARLQAKAYAEAGGWHLGKVLAVESSSAVGSEYSSLRYVRPPPVPQAINAAPIRERLAARITIWADRPSTLTINDSIFVKFELKGSLDPLGDKTWW